MATRIRFGDPEDLFPGTSSHAANAALFLALARKTAHDGRQELALAEYRTALKLWELASRRQPGRWQAELAETREECTAFLHTMDPEGYVEAET